VGASLGTTASEAGKTPGYASPRSELGVLVLLSQTGIDMAGLWVFGNADCCVSHLFVVV
jgi:hypothetical protein